MRLDIQKVTNNMVRRRFFIVALFFIFFVLNLRSQEITGKVINIKEEPIAFANVVLLSNIDSLFIEGTITDIDGYFVFKNKELNAKQYIVKISYLGYEDYYINSDIDNKLDTIILKETEFKLNEIVIEGHKPIFKNIEGNITMDVSNSILSKEHSMSDLLIKMPGIINNRGRIEVFGSGIPTYYINNKKAQNIEEVNSLDIKDIKNIELITNPNSRYDATDNAIIKIITMRKDNGLSYALRVEGIQSEYFSHNESITISYVKNKLNASVYYRFYDYKGQSTQYLTNEIDSDTIWKYATDRLRIPRAKRHYYRLDFDYELNPKHFAGFQIGGSFIDQREKANEFNQVEVNSKLLHSFNSINILKTITSNAQINFFHKSQWSDDLSSDFNVDYVKYAQPREQSVNESYASGKVVGNLNSDSKISIYGGEYILAYNIGNNNKLIGGVNYSFIDGYGNLISSSSSLNNNEYTNKESKLGCFMDYSIKLNRTSFNIGLRYENVYTLYEDILNNINNVNRRYENVFPSFKISYSVNSLTNTLSLITKTERPPLSFLNGQVYYQNKFMYQIGNPQLVPQTSYILEWMLGYRSFNYKVSYAKTYDYISAIFKSPLNDNSKIISTWDNFNKADFIKANINYQSIFFKFWNTSITLGIVKPFFENTYKDNIVKYNKVTLYLSNNNYLRLPSDFLFSFNYYLNTGGSDRIFTSEFFNTLSIGIQKSFFEEKLSVNLKYNDIFKGLRYEETAKINNFNFYQKNQYSEWNFSIDLIYRFNKKSPKYRGQSAAKIEKSRL